MSRHEILRHVCKILCLVDRASLYNLVNKNQIGAKFILSIFIFNVARMGEDKGVHRVLVGKSEGKSHWGDQDVDGRIILRWIFRKLGGGGRGDWMELTQVRDSWRALVCTVRDFRVP
jgi:hypothetical protein